MNVTGNARSVRAGNTMNTTKVRVGMIVISVPDDINHEMAIVAIDEKLYVLCEKPRVVTLLQTREMYERAKAAGVKHITFFTYRWVSIMRYLHRLTTDAYLGDPVSAEFHFIAGFGHSAGYRWRFDARRCLGFLGNFGSHIIDLARWYFGDIGSVSAHLAVTRSYVGLEFCPNNRMISSSLISETKAERIHSIVGISRTVIIIDSNTGGRPRMRYSCISINRSIQGSHRGRAIVRIVFVAAALDGSPNPAPAQECAWVVAFTEVAYLTVSEKRIVSVSADGIVNPDRS